MSADQIDSPESPDDYGIDVWRDMEWVYRNLGSRFPKNPPSSAARSLHAAAKQAPTEFVQRFIKYQQEREARKLVSDGDLTEDRKATLRQIEKLRRAVEPDVDGLLRETCEKFPDRFAVTLAALGWYKPDEEQAEREQRLVRVQQSEAERLRDAEPAKQDEAEKERTRKEWQEQHRIAQENLAKHNAETRIYKAQQAESARERRAQREDAEREKAEQKARKKAEQWEADQERRRLAREKWDEKQERERLLKDAQKRRLREQQEQQDVGHPQEPDPESSDPQTDQLPSVL
jgi:hypothetical protein